MANVITVQNAAGCLPVTAKPSVRTVARRMKRLDKTDEGGESNYDETILSV